MKDIVEGELKEKGIELSVECEDIKTYGLEKEYGNIVIHLITNAEEAIAKRRETDKDFEGRIEVKCENKDGKAYLKVSDNGIGISKELLEKIFEPYFTTKFQSEGIGLTLYASKMSVEKHMNGRIYANCLEEGLEIVIETDFAE